MEPVIAELSPEREKELIEEIANYFHKFGMGTTTILFMESFRGLERITSQMGRVFIGPFFSVFGIHKADEIFALMEKRGNYEKIIDLIEELVNEEKKKEKEESEKSKDKGRFTKFRMWISNKINQ